MQSQQSPWLVVLTVSLSALVTWLVSPTTTHGQDDPGRGSPHRADPCDLLPDPPGRAKGHDKCRGGGSSGVARGDFNGDGFADLAIGVPGKNTPSTVANSGAVYVIYGSADGLLPAGGNGIPATQFWSQNTPGVPDISEADDHFGSALAAGEFNGDQFGDLAIGVPGEDYEGLLDAGRIVVIYGSASGLTATDVTVPPPSAFDLRDAGTVALNLIGDESLGRALAWGDFNGDSIGDLAVGVPGYTLLGSQLRREAGGVWILFGGRGAGLVAAGFQFFTQGSPGVEDASEAYDHFGAVLTAGDFDGDGRSDLAIAAPDEDLSGVRADGRLTFMRDVGAVHVLFGDASGLSGNDSVFLEQLSFFELESRIGFPQGDDQFGSALAAGDFDGDGRVDLAIGAPERTIGNASSAGVVFIVDSRRPTCLSCQFVDKTFFEQANLLVNARESGDRFGFALAAGDFNADGFADLAIGVPYEDISGFQNAGEVNVLYGSGSSLVFGTGSGQQIFRQGGGATGTLEADDRFGMSLSAWNFGRNETRVIGIPPFTIRITVRTADLAIGAPYEDLFNPDGSSIADSGAINVLYGSMDNRLTSTGNQLFFQSNIGGFTNGAIDRFGRFMY